MSRIGKAFEYEDVFVGYLMGGDGGEEKTIKSALALVKGGVDILEIGIPFSDPIADGSVIQEASARALNHKTTPTRVLEMIKKIRLKSEVPIVLMTYYNPILKAGKEFLKKAKASGVDGMIVVDLPFDEGEGYIKMMRDCKLDTIFLVSPNTPQLRLLQIIKHSTGFIYYACQKGTTGMRSTLPNDLAENIKVIKSETDKPVVVGFGIKNKKSAQDVLRVADGFVVGSALVDHIASGATLRQIEAKAKSFR